MIHTNTLAFLSFSDEINGKPGFAKKTANFSQEIRRQTGADRKLSSGKKLSFDKIRERLDLARRKSRYRRLARPWCHEGKKVIVQLANGLVVAIG